MTNDLLAMTPSKRLAAIKLFHTLVWAIVVACIFAIPPLGWAGLYLQVLWMTAVVATEGLVLVLNGGKCPLTAVAARLTDDRRENFDIYLPAWLARHNKRIFTTLLVAGAGSVVLMWLARTP